MKDINKVHCFFEQSGTFKNEFIKLGIPAEDYDIQNNFGETDHVIDLFNEIESAYDCKPSIFDNITQDDLIMAFFPCIHFCDAKTMLFKGVSIVQKNWSIDKIMDKNLALAKERERFFELLIKLVSLCAKRSLRLIIENPWNDSGETYLQRNFIKPTIIDKDRTRRGDVFVKPTAYWFINCENTTGFTLQKDKEVKIVYKAKDKHKVDAGTCSEARSMIHPDYARNFICDFILGKVQREIMKDIEIYNDHFQNFKKYLNCKAQLIIADPPYNLGKNAYASNPKWYVDVENEELRKENKVYERFIIIENLVLLAIIIIKSIL